MPDGLTPRGRPRIVSEQNGRETTTEIIAVNIFAGSGERHAPGIGIPESLFVFFYLRNC